MGGTGQAECYLTFGLHLCTITYCLACIKSKKRDEKQGRLGVCSLPFLPEGLIRCSLHPGGGPSCPTFHREGDTERANSLQKKQTKTR